MELSYVEYVLLKDRIGHIKSDAVDSGERNAIYAIGCPYLLNDDVRVSAAIEIDLTVGDAVNVIVKECVELPVVLPIKHGILIVGLLCKCRRREHCGE